MWNSENCLETFHRKIWLAGWLVHEGWLFGLLVNYIWLVGWSKMFGWLITHLLFFLLPLPLLQPLKGLACLTRNSHEKTLTNVENYNDKKVKVKTTKKQFDLQHKAGLLLQFSSAALQSNLKTDFFIKKYFLFRRKPNLKLSGWETEKGETDNFCCSDSFVCGEIDSSMQTTRHLAAAETTGLWRRITPWSPPWSNPLIKIAY